MMRRDICLSHCLTQQKRLTSYDITKAVVHKCGRKWIGVEMGEHFWTIENISQDNLSHGVDIAETLSNLTGKWIKKINTPSADADTPLQEGNYEVEFEDGEKIELKNSDYKIIKPMVWW